MIMYIIESFANLRFCFFMFIFWHQIYIYTSVPFKLIFGKDGKFHLIQFVCFALKKKLQRCSPAGMCDRSGIS